MSYSRGSRGLALAIASDPAARSGAADALRGRARARNAVAARVSQVSTWASVARAAGSNDACALSRGFAAAAAALAQA
eukprot:1811133-Lingulodinium_polyedra.AAC.1